MAQNRYQNISRPEGLKMSLAALLAELSLADIPDEVLAYCQNLMKSTLPVDPYISPAQLEAFFIKPPYIYSTMIKINFVNLIRTVTIV